MSATAERTGVDADEAIRAFLEARRIAVAGVSSTRPDAANAIFKRLRDAGREVFAVNPNAERAEGAACHPRVSAIPGGVDAVVVATPPAAAGDVVRDAHAAGVRQVWMHRSFGGGSVDEDAARWGREHGMTVIAGACPMMYLAPVDVVHRCFRAILGWTGRLPRRA